MKFRRDRSRTRVGVAAGVAAALAIAVASLSTPAAADPYPAIAYPDKGDYHSFCFTSVFANIPALLSRARYTMDNNDGVEAQTVVNTLEQACGAATDVKYAVDNNLGTGVYGYTACTAWNANYYCDQFVVRINWSYIQQVASDAGFQARKTLCHETGHTLGVDHYDPPYTPSPDSYNSCMISGLWDSGAAWTRTYGQHHKNHINAWFS